MSQILLKIKISVFVNKKTAVPCHPHPLRPNPGFARTGNPWGLASKPTTLAQQAETLLSPGEEGAKSPEALPAPSPGLLEVEGMSFETPLYFTLETVQRISLFRSNTFQDPRCAPARHSAGWTAAHEQWKEAGYWAEHQLSSLTCEWHKPAGNISKRLFL